MTYKKLVCPFCQDDLINASFSQTGLFTYLHCFRCRKRCIVDRKDWEERVKGNPNDDRLNKWVK